MTEDQIKKLLYAIGSTVRDVGEVPSGTIYAAVMDRCTLEEYEGIITMLVLAKVITKHGHLLRGVKNESANQI